MAVKTIMRNAHHKLAKEHHDGDSTDQPLSGEIEITAKRAGMGISCLPVAPGKASDQQAHESGALLTSQPAPVLAYCRTGMRSVTMWAMARKDRLLPAAIVALAREAGYDLQSIIGKSLPQEKTVINGPAYRRGAGVLGKVDIEFFNPGAAFFGVPEYVPALMEYVSLYGIDLRFGHTLAAADGTARTAAFVRTGTNGEKEFMLRPFDMLHVVPPQKAPEFIRSRPLADAAGWMDIHPDTTQRKKWPMFTA